MLKAIRVLLCSLLAVSSCVRADEPVDARRVIGDLSRIVAPTGVQQSYKLKVGGIDQWLYVRGQDTANPVLLFIHGGPASPNMPSSWIYQRPLEEYFTVVNYDQRGAGRSYLEADPDTVRPTLTIDRYVQDAIAIAEHVRTRFGKRKIILMGHSWGTTVGLQAA
ncbi:alpha/beta fold hydrolase, partial [Massilia arenosa]